MVMVKRKKVFKFRIF